MLTLKSFGWRRLTAESTLAYRLDEAGAIRILGGHEPPFQTVRVRSGRGLVAIELENLGLAWEQAEDGDGWILRTTGTPSTMAHVEERWRKLVQAKADPAGLDERLILVTIGSESDDLAPDSQGLVRAPRTEVGYPQRTGESDTGDAERDAEDWRRSGGAHSSHGLMQTLIATAHAACPELFVGMDPALFRTVLMVPKNSIACGVAHASNFSPAIKSDPVQFRVKYGSGGIRAVSTNAWGVDLYDETVILRFIARWNDDACLRAGACTAPPLPKPAPAPAPKPATAAWIFAAFSLFTVSVVAALGAAQLAKAARRSAGEPS